MGPRKAAQIFGGKHGKDPKLAGFEVTLFGSLAATGKGHLTGLLFCFMLNSSPENLF